MPECLSLRKGWLRSDSSNSDFVAHDEADSNVGPGMIPFKKLLPQLFFLFFAHGGIMSDGIVPLHFIQQLVL